MTTPSEAGDLSAPLGWIRSEWESRAIALGFPAYRGRQAHDAIHRRAAAGWEEIPEISRADRERWSQAVPFALPEIVRRDVSSDGTIKYGLRLADGALVETVFMPRGEEASSSGDEFADARGNTARDAAASPRRSDTGREGADPLRATVCLSSQTGCAVDCRFCVTGRLGAGRNLTAGEIVGQLLAVKRENPSPQYALVFMGMGEPMLNLENVEKALDVFAESISPRRTTVSTSGFPEGIARLGRRRSPPNLAVSINAADEKTREKIMPVTRAHPLAEVVAAMRKFPLAHRRRITAEYVLLSGVNDSPDDARRLARLLRGIPVKINVIPFNPDPHVPEFRPPSEGAVTRFVETLARERYTVTVRRSKGPDAAAACGQLKGREVDSRRAKK